MPKSQFYDLPQFEDLRAREANAVIEAQEGQRRRHDAINAQKRITGQAESAATKEGPKLAEALAADWHRRWNLAIERSAMAAARNRILLAHGVQLPPGHMATEVHLVNVEFHLGQLAAEVEQPKGRRGR